MREGRGARNNPIREEEKQATIKVGPLEWWIRLSQSALPMTPMSPMRLLALRSCEVPSQGGAWGWVSAKELQRERRPRYSKCGSLARSTIDHTSTLETAQRTSIRGASIIEVATACRTECWPFYKSLKRTPAI